MRQRNQRLQAFARANRHNPTPAEQKLWQILRGNRFHGVKFYQQVQIGDFVVDFVSRQQMLAIEVDGETHPDNADYDERRTFVLEQEGFLVLRFTNADVMGNLEGVYATIEQALRR